MVVGVHCRSRTNGYVGHAVAARQVLDVLVDRAVGERHEVRIGDGRDRGHQVARLDDDDLERRRVEAQRGEVRDLVERAAPRGEHEGDPVDVDHRLALGQACRSWPGTRTLRRDLDRRAGLGIERRPDLERDRRPDARLVAGLGPRPVGDAGEHGVADLHPQQFRQRVGAVARAAARRVVARVGEHHRARVKRLRLRDHLGHRARRHAERELRAGIPVLLRQLRRGLVQRLRPGSRSTAAAVARASSAQTYPTSSDTSITPSRAFMRRELAPQALRRLVHGAAAFAGHEDGDGCPDQRRPDALVEAADEHVAGALVRLFAVDVRRGPEGRHHVEVVDDAPAQVAVEVVAGGDQAALTHDRAHRGDPVAFGIRHAVDVHGAVHRQVHAVERHQLAQPAQEFRLQGVVGRPLHAPARARRSRGTPA